ncbi:hypothetical protein PHYNN_139 [Pantoea phage Phynn]|nr:hypothetical protein PHYNN_139 [Pantoea phage Phynn]
MIYYEDNNSSVMTPAAFKAMFGLSYAEFQKSEDGVTARKVKFSDAHCCIDPYALEIANKVVPIVENNYLDLREAEKEAAYEI